MGCVLKPWIAPRVAAAGGAPPGGGGGGGRSSLVMTPQLRKAIELLQLSRLELIEEIRRELGGDEAADTVPAAVRR
jgi:Sigma-54 factor, Activator interacting domain (AID)